MVDNTLLSGVIAEMKMPGLIRNILRHIGDVSTHDTELPEAIFLTDRQRFASALLHNLGFFGCTPNSFNCAGKGSGGFSLQAEGMFAGSARTFSSLTSAAI